MSLQGDALLLARGGNQNQGRFRRRLTCKARGDNQAGTAFYLSITRRDSDSSGQPRSANRMSVTRARSQSEQRGERGGQRGEAADFGVGELLFEAALPGLA